MSHATHRRRRGGRCLAVVAAAGALAAAAFGVVGGASSGEVPDAPITGSSAHMSLRAVADAGSGSPASTRPNAHDPGRWERVLRVLDRRRARAFSTGDLALLSRVYLPGSRVLRHDRAVLMAYQRRGLTLHGVRLHLLDVRAHRAGQGRVAVRVVDRLGVVTARATGGSARALPRDGPTAHRVVLCRVDGAWRIAAVAALSG